MRKQAKKGMNARRIAAVLALLSYTAYLPIPAFAVNFDTNIDKNTLPTFDSVVNGTEGAAFLNSEGRMQKDMTIAPGNGTVMQATGAFNIGSNATLNTVATGASQVAMYLNNTNDPSVILGKMTQSSGIEGCPSCANSLRVMVLNPNGILVGQGAEINLNSFTATTYGIDGIRKDIQNMTEAELAAYAGQLQEINGSQYRTNGTLFNLAGYNKTVKFVSDGKGDGVIEADGALFHFKDTTTKDATGKLINDQNGAKTVALVSDNINVKDSIINTHFTSKPNATGNQIKSNVKLVTGDGVNFYYTSVGDVRDVDGVKDANGNLVRTSYRNIDSKSPSVEKNINVDNTQIYTGSLDVVNGTKGDKGSVNITNNTKIYTNKMLGGETAKYKPQETGTFGQLTIDSVGDVNIKNSVVETMNDLVNGSEVGALIADGNLKVTAGKNINIEDSQVRTADSVQNTDVNNIKSGNITLTAGNNVNIVQKNGAPSRYAGDNTGVVASGDLTVKAGNKVTIDGYDEIHAQGYKHDAAVEPAVARNLNRTMSIKAKDVDINNTKLVRANDILVNADNKIDVAGTNLVAKDNINLLGQNTTIDNSLVEYNGIAFYDPNGTKVNNVTLKNNTTMNDKDSDGLTIVTNGNLTVDSADLGKKAYNKNGQSTKTTQKFVQLKSTTGDINVQNNANVNSLNGNITLAAKNNVTVDKASVYAKNGDVNVVANSGKVQAKGTAANNAKIVAEGGSTSITQANDLDLNGDFGNSLVGGTTKLTLKSTQGSVKGVNLVNGAENIGAYKNVKTLSDTSKNARFTLSNNAEIVAKNDIVLDGPGDLTVTDLTTDSGNGTTISAAAKLNVDGLDIKNGPTTLNGGNGIKTPDNKVINANGNKLALNSPKDIDVNVKGVDNPNNGLEVNAKINTGIHNGNNYGQDELIGRNVKINAVDGKLAVSKIKADKLNLITDDIIEGKADITREWDHVKGFSDPEVNAMNGNKAYIEVRTDGAFNIDATTTYDNTPNVEYIKNRNSESTDKDIYGAWDSKSTSTTLDPGYSNKLVKVEGTETYKKVEGTEAKTGQSTDPKFVGTEVVEDWKTVDLYDENGKKIGTQQVRTVKDNYEVQDQISWTENQYADYYYESKSPTVSTENYQERTHKVETTTVDKEHTATIKNGTPEGFVLVYSKTSQSTKNLPNETKSDGNITTGGDISKSDNFNQLTGNSKTAYGYSDPRIESKIRVEKEPPCIDPDEPEPNVPQADPQYTGDDFSSWVRIPRHAEGTSNMAPVQNDIADTSSAVVAAAARLQLDDSDDEDDILE